MIPTKQKFNPGRLTDMDIKARIRKANLIEDMMFLYFAQIGRYELQKILDSPAPIDKQNRSNIILALRYGGQL